MYFRKYVNFLIASGNLYLLQIMSRFFVNIMENCECEYGCYDINGKFSEMITTMKKTT